MNLFPAVASAVGAALATMAVGAALAAMAVGAALAAMRRQAQRRDVWPGRTVSRRIADTVRSYGMAVVSR